MLYTLLLPLLAIVGGTAGVHLRRWELSSSFNEEALPMPGAPATVALIVLSAILALIFLLFCLCNRNKTATLGKAFSCSGNWAYLIFCLLAAALLPAAAAAGLWAEFTAWAPNYLRVFLWILCIPSGICIAVTGFRNFRALPHSYSLVTLLPSFTGCIWLISACQTLSANPVALDYVYELFAIICTLLSLYFTASLSFVRTKVWPYVLFSLLGLYFSMVTLADQHDSASVLLLSFAIVHQLIHVTVLLRRTFPFQKKKPFGGHRS